MTDRNEAIITNEAAHAAKVPDEWRHLDEFGISLVELGHLAAQVSASVDAARETKSGGPDFHRVMFMLANQVTALKGSIATFQHFQDEYERTNGSHRTK
jgi:hypothetical protein